MGRESFILVSLKEEKAKKLAQVINNESCRAILDYLAEKESTESELATLLNLPISTVHYNLKHLVDAGLVSAQEFHYSEKGKEVLHYKLSNKYVIIAPRSTFGLKEKLRSILPVAAISVAVAGVLQIFSMGYSKAATSMPRITTSSSEKMIPPVVETVRTFSDSVGGAMPSVASESASRILGEPSAQAAGLEVTKDAAEPLVHNVTQVITNNVTQVVEKTTQVVKEYTTTNYVVPPSIAFWFITGAMFAIVAYLLVSFILRKRE